MAIDTTTQVMMMDADTHVDECDETWTYFPKDKQELAPRTIEFNAEQEPSWVTVPDSGSRHSRLWFIDGQVYPRRYRNDAKTGTTKETRELRDIPSRIADMDALQIDCHVIYPTALLSEVTLQPELSTLLCQSYNRWLADRCADTGGRLTWVAMLPMLSIPEALAEMKFAKEHGACGIFKRGVECEHRAANDEHFFPIYAQASDLDMPICMHAGVEWRARERNLSTFPYPRGFEGLEGCRALIEGKVYRRFPALRFGFIEFGAAWLPHVLRVIGCKDSLEEMNFYVTCEVGEDVGYLVSKIGNENLMVGSDYSHADRASVRDAHAQMLSRDDLDGSSALKLTNSNARTFYGVSK